MGTRIEVINLLTERPTGDITASSNDGSRLFQLSTGFLRLMKSDDELAFLIATLLSQTITEQRREEMNVSSLVNLSEIPWIPLNIPHGMLVQLAIGTGSGLLASVAALSLTLAPSSKLLDSMSKVRQRESDYIGLLLMTNAGYDPTAAVTALESMNKARSQAGSEGGLVQALANSGNIDVSLWCLVTMDQSSESSHKLIADLIVFV